jgi:hypothetical protein
MVEFQVNSEPTAVTPAIRTAVAVVVGNGFVTDCTGQLGLSGLDPGAPLDWPLTIPAQPALSVRDALPKFFTAIDRLKASRRGANQFDLLRETVGPRDRAGSEVEVETRHFLTLAYRFFTCALTLAPIEQWRWMQWLREYAEVLLTTVSFNYDCLLERALSLSGRQYHRMHKVAPGIIRVFKPHGSADFDLEGMTKERLSYPLRLYAHMNDFPLKIVPADEWSHPPAEPLIVLPYEENPYSQFQWVKPGYHIFGQLGQQLTHCVFVGLSYHAADRAEIDHFLYCTPRNCRIIIANPTPPKDFIDAVRASGRELHLWTSGPESLPIG